MAKPTSITDDALIFFDHLTEATAGIFAPRCVRLGVTGLARAGKTVFITALVHNLIHGGRLPLFSPYAEGRIRQGFLQPQPDDDVPRFDYESHVAALTGEDRAWPRSTRRISQLRLTIAYESASLFSRALGSGNLNIDIVDYPGEWLLDLALLGKPYAQWARETLHRARSGAHGDVAREWLAFVRNLDPLAAQSEDIAQEAARAFSAYLAAARAHKALSMLPPGRFLMPGDLCGSPALTFAPIDPPVQGDAPAGSLFAMMERRYEAYKSHVVKPFFRQHFARLDRQIVLVDALAALNAGPAALADLEETLAQTLACFRPGPTSWLSSILSRRIDRILFAATKADHLHRTSHDRLEALMQAVVARALERAAYRGADVKSLALASVRATREAVARHNGEDLPCIVGVPVAGETLGGEIFDGKRQAAIFPGDLPRDPARLIEQKTLPAPQATQHQGLAGATERLTPLANPEPRPYAVDVVRFRPPDLETSKTGVTLSLPHIRLDKALEFLLGDKLA